MPVNLTTGNSNYSVNSSRIQKFITAGNRDDALRMGGWDKFKDLFRATTDKKATKIAQIYDSIVGESSGDRKPLTMLDRFHALKSMAASPEDRAQFRTTYTAPGADPGAAPNTWGYAFAIGDTRIHEQTGVPDVHGSLGRTFEQAMLVKELEHHIDQLPAAFQQSEANRNIDPGYINGKVSIMASREDGGSAESSRLLLENLDNPFFCRSNLKDLQLSDNGQTMVATFAKDGRESTLSFNAVADPRDPLMPCGDTLRRWLQDSDYASMRNLIETKAKTPDDNKSVNDFKGLGLRAIQNAYTAAGKQVDPLSLINGSVQNELATAIREVHEANPESARPVIAKLFNMKVPGFTDSDRDFAVRNFLGADFCAANGPFIDQARQVAADALRAPVAAPDVEPDEVSAQNIPPVPDIRAPRGEADQFLASHLVNYRNLNILGTVVGGGARPAGDYLVGATQDEVLAKIREAGFTTVLSIDQGSDSQALTGAIQRAGLQHQISGQYEFPDWEHAPDTLYLDIKRFIEEKASQGERVFIHCGAGCGRTGAVLSALTLGHLIGQEQARSEQLGKRFDVSDYANSPKLEMSAAFKVLRDEDGELQTDPYGEPEVSREVTTYALPYLAAHAVQAVRDAVKDNTAPTASAVETNEQLVDVANFAAHLLPPPPLVGQGNFA